MILRGAGEPFIFGGAQFSIADWIPDFEGLSFTPLLNRFAKNNKDLTLKGNDNNNTIKKLKGIMDSQMYDIMSFLCYYVLCYVICSIKTMSPNIRCKRVDSPEGSGSGSCC